MADFSKPNLDSEIVSNLSDIRSNVDASVVMLKGIAPTGANFPIDAVLFDQGRFQRWNGSQFNDALIGISGGGTGASTSSGARQNIGADNAENLTQGILPAARLIGEYNIDISGTAADSDTLDGQHGSFYQNASNLNTGTVDRDRLPNAGSGENGVVYQNAIDISVNGTLRGISNCSVRVSRTGNLVNIVNTTEISYSAFESRTTVNTLSGFLPSWAVPSFNARNMSSNNYTTDYLIVWVNGDVLGIDSVNIDTGSSSPISSFDIGCLNITYAV